MTIKSLDIPPDALLDDQAFEIMRVWAGGGQLHTIISSSLKGGAKNFGELLADLFEHASRMYAQRDKRGLEDCRRIMLAKFMRRVDAPEPSISGQIPSKH